MILWRIQRWHEVRWHPTPSPLTLSWGNLPGSQGNLPHKGQKQQEEEGTIGRVATNGPKA